MVRNPFYVRNLSNSNFTIFRSIFTKRDAQVRTFKQILYCIFFTLEYLDELPLPFSKKQIQRMLSQGISKKNVNNKNPAVLVKSQNCKSQTSVDNPLKKKHKCKVFNNVREPLFYLRSVKAKSILPSQRLESRV